MEKQANELFKNCSLFFRLEKVIIKIFYLIRIIPKIGLYQMMYIVWYRLSLSLGLRKKWFKKYTIECTDLFEESEVVKDYPEMWKIPTLRKADKIIDGIFTWFHKHEFNVGEIPSWFYNPFDDLTLNSEETLKHWTEINDFTTDVGDIKTIWELSRFDWLLDLTRAYKISGKKHYLDRLNRLLKDWIEKNPINSGPNWKCGQETSIRVMKLFLAALLFNVEKNVNNDLQQVVYAHVKRIYPNIRYAIVQDNNHGTSEAIGLYLGATWLLNQKKSTFTEEEKAFLTRVKKRGRKLLINRIDKLIDKDGTFSQNSTNYHRVVADSLSFMLVGMEVFNEPKLPERCLKKLSCFLDWQKEMVFGSNGEVPNLGANDGAMLNTLHNCDYKDFRPSTQLLSVLLKGELAFAKGAWDESLFWFRKTLKQNYYEYTVTSSKKQVVRNFDDRYVVLKNDLISVLFVVPNDLFRPNNDPFHIDIWIRGVPFCIDAGTYSYNHETLTKEFKSIKSHNTVQFGQNEPMPQISRFLTGEWIKAKNVTISNTDKVITVQASYSDYLGNTHTRKLELNKNTLVVEDYCVSELAPSMRFHFHQNGFNKITSNNQYSLKFDTENVTVTISSKKAIKLEEYESKASNYYLDYTLHPTIEINFTEKDRVNSIKTIFTVN